MRDAKRIPLILDTLKSVWERNPDLRLGQLLANALRLERQTLLDQEPRLFYIEDEQLLELIKKHLTNEQQNRK